MQQNTSQNIMGYERVPKLILKISFPLMLSMLVQALYNIVDSIFVAMLSETALTAVSLVYPLQNLMIAFSVGTAVGVNSFLARKLGEGDREKAEETARNGLLLSVITWFLFVFIGIFCSRPFLAMYTEDPQLLDLATQYSVIILVFSVGVFIDITVERIMQATGDSVHPMIAQMSGAITNIILDPVFIFTFNLGVAGAAIATVIGQFVSMFIALFFLKRNKYIILRIRPIRLDRYIVKNIYTVGAPTIVTNSISTVMVSFMNSILIAFTPTAVSVFGVYFKLQSFVFMPIFGLNAGMTAILAFNYGAGNKDRMIEGIKFGTLISFIIMLVGFLVFQLFPQELLRLFSASENMMTIGVKALRIISIHFLIVGLAINLTSVYQATGVGLASMIISISRQLVALVPSAWILGHFWGLDAVWFSFVFAEIVSGILSLMFFAWIYRTRIRDLSPKH